jgi:hypothetical protein
MPGSSSAPIKRPGARTHRRRSSSAG